MYTNRWTGFIPVLDEINRLPKPRRRVRTCLPTAEWVARNQFKDGAIANGAARPDRIVSKRQNWK